LEYGNEFQRAIQSAGVSAGNAGNAGGKVKFPSSLDISLRPVGDFDIDLNRVQYYGVCSRCK